MRTTTLAPVVKRCVAVLFGLTVMAGIELRFTPQTTSTAAQGTLDYQYYKDNIEPMFIRPRGSFAPPDPGMPACVMCHTWQANTPMKLERLTENPNGSVLWTEAQSRRNFEVVSSLVTPGDPDNSRLLRKPLAVAAGGAPAHIGGKFWASKDDPEWKVLADWVRKAGPARAAAAAPAAPDYGFFRACVQPIFVSPNKNAIRCTECHGGNNGFATDLPAGKAEWAEEESKKAYDELMKLVVPGQPTQSRFLMHPLHPVGGGDYAHNGVKRWTSMDDPEWQMLAAWVKGERKGANCGR